MTSSPHLHQPDTAPPLQDDETIVHSIPHAHAVSTEDAESSFDRLLDKAQENPTAITRQGKPVAVVLSVQEYECLRRLDDFYWEARAKEGKAKSDGLNVEEAEEFFHKLLDDPD